MAVIGLVPSVRGSVNRDAVSRCPRQKKLGVHHRATHRLRVPTKEKERRRGHCVGGDVASRFVHNREPHLCPDPFQRKAIRAPGSEEKVGSVTDEDLTLEVACVDHGGRQERDDCSDNEVPQTEAAPPLQVQPSARCAETTTPATRDWLRPASDTAVQGLGDGTQSTDVRTVAAIVHRNQFSSFGVGRPHGSDSLCFAGWIRRPHAFLVA
mmetsp:Transcript_15793/g.43163  ORF Transcript_15793/g.43163 Transcript_15793/m.43163 type:complete len:210 (-) Transcript_15793:27-656(-)